MTRKTNTMLIGLLGTILLGLGTWVLVTIIELQTMVVMMSQELMSLDKVIERIYAHMDRLDPIDNERKLTRRIYRYAIRGRI